MLNLFVVISPSHILNCELLIEHKKIEGTYVLINPGNYSFNKELWDIVVVGDFNLNYTASTKREKFKYQIDKILFYKRFSSKIKRKINFSEITSYFYFNLDDILSNHIFNSLEKVNNYVIEDGILNYYYPEKSNKLKLKTFLTKIFGLKFSEINHHPTNIKSSKVNGQFVRLPERAIFPEKSIQLPFYSQPLETINNKILIVGQDIMTNTEGGIPYYKERFGVLLDKIKADNLNIKSLEVIYKPHRNGDSTIAEAILKDYFSTISIYRDNTPIEQSIYNIKPFKVYSFESSAILNLKLAFLDKLYFGVLPFKDGNSTIINLYRNLEIDILT